jgi:hypothetical protein
LVKHTNKVDYGEGKWFSTCDYCPAKHTKYFKENCEKFTILSKSEVRKYDAKG